MQHFHPISSGGNFRYVQAIGAPRQAENGNLKSFFTFLETLGAKFLLNASIIPPKTGHGDVGRHVRECQGGRYAGKVVGAMAIDLGRLDELKAFVSGQAGNGMLFAARSGKLFVIDPKL